MDNNNRNTRSEAEEFNAFNASSAPAKEAKKRPQQKKAKGAPKKKGSFLKKIDKKIFIGIAIGLLVLLLVAGIVVFALSRDRHIMREDNAFLVYADADNHYHLLVNGNEIEKDFEGEVELKVAENNAFAYVIDRGEDGYYIYLLKGKKLEPITQSGVGKPIAYAMLEPGVLYEDGDKIRLWNEDVGETTVARLSNGAANFMISGDASTIVYTEPNKNSTAQVEFKLFRPSEGVEESLGSSKIVYTPERISNYGDYVYASFIKNDVKNLCVFKTNDLDELSGSPIAESDNFTRIIDINAKGDELLFYTTKLSKNNERVASTMLFRYDHEEPTAELLLNNGILSPKKVDPDIVYFDDFEDVYMTAGKPSDLTARAIYRMDKYVPTKLANYKIAADSVATDPSVIDPQERYLYYINEDQELIQMDLKDENHNVTARIDDVQDFYITQKGNIYFLESEGTLRFREANKKRNNRIAEDVLDISFYRYANTLYYTKDEAASIFMTKEGSVEEPVKMDSAQVTSLPLFTETNCKQTYAASYDTDNGGRIFFTANGKKFKQLTNDCEWITYNNISSDLLDVLD